MANEIHVNVGGTWKTVTNYYLNVGGTWKTGTQFDIKINDDWKGGEAVTGNLPSFADVTGLDYVEWSLPAAFVNAKSTIDSSGLDYVDWSLPVACIPSGAAGLVYTNLKLNLNAANSISYGGSGTTWIDLVSGDNARSVDFDGTDDKLSIPDSTDFEFGSGDFTIEAWVKQENAAGSANTFDHSIVNKWDNTSNAKEWQFRIKGDYLQWVQTTDGSNNQWTTGNTVINAGQWYHLAVVGHSGTIKLFVNGTQQSSTGTQSTINSHSNPLIFGYNESTNASWMDGLMSNCRIIKGTALYTSSFTPPTEPLTNVTNTKFLGLNNSSITGSTVSPGTITASSSPTASISNPFGVHGTISGATYSSSNGGIFDFDGTDDSISIPDDASLEPTNVDWTFEAWINVDSGAAGDYNCIFSKNAPIQIYWYDNKILAWFSAADDTGSYFVTGISSGSNSLTTGGWHHVVISRASNVWKIYVDKVEKYSATHNGTVFDGTATAYIGNYGGSSYFFNGKIAQVRVYKGTGLTSTQVAENYNATKSTFGL